MALNLPPEVLAAITSGMQSQLGGNALYQDLSAIAPAETRVMGGGQPANWTPYDESLAALQANPLLGADPVAYYMSQGGGNVRAYNQPDDIAKIVSQQLELQQDVGKLQAQQYEWRADQETRDREAAEFKMQFGDPLIDVNSFIDMQLREHPELTKGDIIASLQPSDPNYVENVQALFDTLKPIDPYDKTGAPASPDSSYGRIWLSNIQQNLPGIAQDTMAQEAADQATAIEDQAFRRSYMNAVNPPGKGEGEGWVNTSDNQWFFGPGAEKRAAAWEESGKATPEQLAYRRERAAKGRETARSEYLARQKASREERTAGSVSGVDPLLAASIEQPTPTENYGSIIPTAGPATAAYEDRRADVVGRPQAAVETARAVLQGQTTEPAFGGSILPDLSHIVRPTTTVPENPREQYTFQPRTQVVMPTVNGIPTGFPVFNMQTGQFDVPRSVVAPARPTQQPRVVPRIPDNRR